MIIMAHVRGRRPQPRLTTRHLAAGKLPRGRQDQEPNPCQPAALARRAHRATPRRAARRQTAARRRGGGNRPRAAARPRAGRARHRAPHCARRRAAAPRAATPARSGAGRDRCAPARARAQAGDRADAGSRHRQPFAGRDAGARQGHRQGGLCRARLAGPRAAVYRSQAGPPPPEGWRAAALRCHLHPRFRGGRLYLEGRCCELAQHGYSRDHRGDRPQLVIGLMCAADGCPVAIEVFEGNTADPMTLAAQIDKLKQRFKLQRVVMVGDRGLLTSARIEQTLRPAGLDWITAIRAPAIKQLAAAGGPLQPSLFDDRDMAEITSPDYPGERLVVCKNPLLAEERARKRAELLAGTENDLARIAARVQRARSPLRGAAAIGQAVGAVLGRRHMAKHFQISIGDDTFSFAQNPLRIAAEAALDGIYVVRTKTCRPNTPMPPRGQARGLTAHATVRAYKSLSGVEHAFRSLKTVDLELRPVFHWTAPRVRAHVLLCMLAYYLQWHMRRCLAPMLFDEPDPTAREAPRTSPVVKAEPSPAAQRKAARKRTDPADGEPLPVHSFHTLLGDLATLTRHGVRLRRDHLTTILTTPTRTQHHALDLLGVTPTAETDRHHRCKTISMACAQKRAKFGLKHGHHRLSARAKQERPG